MLLAGAVVVLLIAVGVGAVVLTTGDDGGTTGADPGGDERSRISLPPRGRWFGFSSGTFTQTGRDPALDVGVTPERAAADGLAAGANSARVPFSWRETQPQPGRFDTGYLGLVDRFVRAFERGGGRVLFFIGGPPDWASDRPGDLAAPPAPRADRAFAAFAAFVAKRYPRAAGIETWNEPNASFFWTPAPDPARYARLHALAARAIRAANPRMKVVLGGLAGTRYETAQVMRPQTYLRRMFEAGLRPGDYDALGFHPYPAQTGGRIGSLNGGQFAGVFEDFRSGYGKRDPGAEVWITETGLTTSGPEPLTADRQAEDLPPLLAKLLTMPRVKAVYVHTQYELPSQPQTSPERGFGLLHARRAEPGMPKPAFCAVRDLAASPPPFPACP
jgi:hypothetical protein